jgi:hypothetical protein
MKRNKMEEKKFDPDMTIHTPSESPYRVYKTYIVLKIFIMIFQALKGAL